MNGADVLLRLMLAAYAGGGAAALFLRGRPGRFLGAAGATLGAVVSVTLAVMVLGGAENPEWTVRAFALTPLAFKLDALGAFFLAVVGLVGAAAAIFSHAYSSEFQGWTLRVAGANLNLLLLSLGLQVMADNPLTFLMVWEVMSLSAYFFVLTEPDQPEAISAANWYLGVTHAGFAALIALFFVFSKGQLTLSFSELQGATLSPGARNAIFLLALFGFGTKAGIIPLHVWLPRAHPVAPSHASALMSGVVLKMGVYGLVRVIFDLLGGGWPWWGMSVLALGTVSALFGVLYALMQHDLKRLLAYHSIENIGIIYMGIGAALLFGSYQMPLLAALALAAALYHTLNHACFKGLLFLAAGAVVRSVHTRNIEEMGGLIKRMPRTALAFLIGSAAISALPPLNGFASEWLLFQALLGGARIPSPAVALIMPIGVGLLALTGGLAAACFVKAFGITFLAIPRSHPAEQATEAPRSMHLAMLILVIACVTLGLGPFAVVPALGHIVADLPGLEAAAELRVSNGFSADMPEGLGQMSPPFIAAGLLVIALLLFLALWLATPALKLRRSETWGCGRAFQTPRMQYTATAFAEPLRRVFAEVYRPAEDLTVTVHPESKYFIRSISYESRVRPIIDRLIYAPILNVVRRTAQAARSLQAGSVHLYLAYLCAALIILLIAARWLP